MLPIVDIIIAWLHLIAAFTWVGGLIFVNVVLTPVVGRSGIPPHLIRIMGMERFRWFAWGSIAVLILTGVYAILQSIPAASVFVTTPYGLTLLIKLVVVGLMIGITATNTLVLRKKVVGATAGTPGPAMQTISRRLVVLSRVNLALGLVVLLLVAVLKWVH
jgi:copper resistance protein D